MLLFYFYCLAFRRSQKCVRCIHISVWLVTMEPLLSSDEQLFIGNFYCLNKITLLSFKVTVTIVVDVTTGPKVGNAKPSRCEVR